MTGPWAAAARAVMSRLGRGPRLTPRRPGGPHTGTSFSTEVLPSEPSASVHGGRTSVEVCVSPIPPLRRAVLNAGPGPGRCQREEVRLSRKSTRWLCFPCTGRKPCPTHGDACSRAVTQETRPALPGARGDGMSPAAAGSAVGNPGAAAGQQAAAVCWPGASRDTLESSPLLSVAFFCKAGIRARFSSTNYGIVRAGASWKHEALQVEMVKKAQAVMQVHYTAQRRALPGVRMSPGLRRLD